MAEAFPSTTTELELEEIISEAEIEDIPQKPLNMKPGAVQLRSWLNKSLKIQMPDGRVLVGVFLCTDRDANVILGSCTEYLPADEKSTESVVEEPRMLGLVMVPGKHITSVAIDQGTEPDLSVLLGKAINSVNIT